MKVTVVANRPPEDFKGITFTNEQMAAILARYSRSDKGIEALYDKHKDSNPETIMKFADYGHASILGLTGQINVCIDGCSMFFAMHLFKLARCGSGQEASTRYIKFGKAKTINLETMDLPKELRLEYSSLMDECLEMYDTSRIHFKKQAPDMRHVEDLRVRKRLENNWANDRAREWLPMALSTSMTVMMNAQEWCKILRELKSYPFNEFIQIAYSIEVELKKIIPAAIRHTESTEASIHNIKMVYDYEKKIMIMPDYIKERPFDNFQTFEVESKMNTDSPFEKKNCFPRANRYDSFSQCLKMARISYGFEKVPLSIIRDCNRHRTGEAVIYTVPQGFFYCTNLNYDQKKLLTKVNNMMMKLVEHGKHPYGLLFGHQCGYLHSTQLHHAIYEVELRTGPGAHYLYAQVYEKLGWQIKKAQPNIPINIGSAEVEEF